MAYVGVDLGGEDFTVYQIDGVPYKVRPRYYLASCDACGWIGSSEECGTDDYGDDSDVYCPTCHAPGADCGKIALLAESAERSETINAMR